MAEAAAEDPNRVPTDGASTTRLRYTEDGVRFKLLKMALVDATVEAGSLETPEAKPEATPDAMAEVGSLETPDVAAVAELASRNL